MGKLLHSCSLIYSTENSESHAVAQLAEALSYKPKGRELDYRWCHRNFFIDIILPGAL